MATTEARRCCRRYSRQACIDGEVSTSRTTIGVRSRTAVPVGPLPVSSPSQVM